MLPVGEIHTIDLDFLEESSSIASFIIQSNDGLILIESVLKQPLNI